MKILHVDWEALLGFVEAWESLPPPARGLLLDSKPKAVMPRSAAGRDLAQLLEAGFLDAMADGERVQLADAFHETHKVLRALVRHPLLQQPDSRTLREYLGEHFTGEERRALSESDGFGHERDAHLLATITSAAHARGFLATKDVRAWEKERLPVAHWTGEQATTQTEPLLKDKKAAGDLVRLIETLAAVPAPIPLRALAERVGLPSRARLGAAIEAGLRYLLCFPAFDAKFAPVLTLWPSVAARMHRAAAPPPTAVVPDDSFCLAYRMEDLTQLLVRAAEPLRMKSNGWSLFAAAERELEEGLLPLPAWLTEPRLFPENAPGARVREALHLARELELLGVTGKRGRDFGLVTTPAGWAWLDQSPHDRLAVLLDLQRPELETLGGRSEGEEEDDEDPFDEDGDELELELLDAELADAIEGELVPFEGGRSRRSNALSDTALFGHSTDGGLARAAIGAFAKLEPGRAVLVSDFMRHHAEASNPLLELANPQHFGFGGYWNPPTEELLEELWIQGLQRILHIYLLPFGGVSVGIASAGGMTIELTAIGRFVLGLAPEFVLDAPAPSKTPVRVQPDFEVVFVAASPSIEAALSRFAERRGTGVGVLFRITRDSIMSAAQAGLGADEVLATLARASSTPVPANVEHEIRAWFGRCRRLSIEPVHLLRCPDAATAARVLSAVGAGKLELVSETVLALRDPKHKAAVMRLCRKAGLFLVNSTEPPAPARGRRRRARWR